jgi:hypothetical protein
VGRLEVLKRHRARSRVHRKIRAIDSVATTLLQLHYDTV